MQEKLNLTREQVLFLSFIGVIGNMVYTHTWIVDTTGRAEWVASLLGILLITPFVIWTFYLGKFHPQGNIFDILENGLGKIISSGIALLFILINIALAVAQLNMFTQMLNAFFLQFTPAWVIMLVLTAICLMFANGGIQVFGRLTEVLAVMGIINFFAAFIFVYPNFFRIEYIIPIFETPLIDFGKGTMFMTGAAAEILLILMIIIRYIPDPGKHYMWGVKGTVLSAVVFALAIFIIIGMMGAELAKGIAFGGVNAAEIVQIGEFLQGLEIFIFGTYQFIAIGKITLSIYVAWIAGKKIFSEKLPFLQLFIIALMILIPSIWLTSYNKAYVLGVAMGYIILPFSVFVLLLSTLSVIIRNKKTGSASK